LRITFILAFRVRVFGQLNVPRRGGVLIVSNHQSYLDPALLSLGFERSVSFMARRTLFRNPAFGRLIAALNAFPVTRGGLDIAAMREAVRRLQNGECLVVFPEGTRTSDGSIAPLHPGILAIVERANVPIVPAVIEGAFEAWPRGSTPRANEISVLYGRAIRPEEHSRLSRAELVERLQSELSRLETELRKRKICSRIGAVSVRQDRPEYGTGSFGSRQCAGPPGS
jgi:1-acyl-sn-glycerol-3-phosphate acyltransferase